MNVMVFGAGAMGSLVGGLLAAQHEVTLVGRRAHVEAIRQSGLRIRGLTQLRVHPRAVEDASEAPDPDLVIVTVKSPGTQSAATTLRRAAPRALILSLQNGLGNVECLAAEGRARVLAGVTYQGVTFAGPGEIVHAGAGETLVGAFSCTSPSEAAAVAEMLDAAGLEARHTEDVTTALWNKAVVNACFNPLTGLLRLPSGALGQSPALLECCEMVVAEAVAVAAARGVSLDPAALMARVREVSRATAANRSSMLQDLERGRPTEIDAINGAIARMGDASGVPCPVNRVLTQLVRAAEASRTPRTGRA